MHFNIDNVRKNDPEVAKVLDLELGDVVSVAVSLPNIVAGIETAVQFELAWLKNKRDYYGAIAREDAARIAMIERRLASNDRERIAG